MPTLRGPTRYGSRLFARRRHARQLRRSLAAHGHTAEVAWLPTMLFVPITQMFEPITQHARAFYVITTAPERLVRELEDELIAKELGR